MPGIIYGMSETVKSKGEQTDKSATEKITGNGTARNFLRKLGLAALTTIIVFFLFVYINTGIVLFIPLEYLPDVLTELLLFFILLLTVFWTHGRIAAFLRLPALQNISSAARSLLEATLVIVSTLLLNYLIMFLPLFYVLNAGPLPEGRMRTVMVLTSVISLFFYYFIERERSRKKLQAEFLRSEQLQKENFRAQLNSLKAQMNPHFLFNSLNVLTSLIYVDRDKAAEFTRELAHVYRSFLDKSGKAVVPLTEEMDLVRSYITLLKTRFEEDLQIDIGIPAGKEDYRLPPGSVQLLVENAIKHNGFNARRPLRVSIYLEADNLVVENNLQPRKEAPASGRHGLKNIQGRYHLLTDRPVEIRKTEDQFIVKLPLLKKEQTHEDRNH